MTAAAIKISSGHADFQDHVGSHGAAIGLATHTVSSKMFPGHELFPSAGYL
jgi:hypothetical protein